MLNQSSCALGECVCVWGGGGGGGGGVNGYIPLHSQIKWNEYGTSYIVFCACVVFLHIVAASLWTQYGFLIESNWIWKPLTSNLTFSVISGHSFLKWIVSKVGLFL